jgi:hypothetical protein
MRDVKADEGGGSMKTFKNDGGRHLSQFLHPK